MNKSIQPRTLGSCAILAAGVLFLPKLSNASEFPELRRLEPVPADQQIPVIDFVRPDMMTDARLNRDGTQVGAIVPGGEDDHTDIITYDLANQKLDGIGGPSGDMDISTFEWLDHNRLVYIVTQKKLVGRYLFVSEAGKLSNAEQVFPPKLEAGRAAEGVSTSGSISIITNPAEDRSQLLVRIGGYNYRYDHVEMISPVNHGVLTARYPELKTDHGFNLGFFPDKKGELAFGITQEDGIFSLSKLEGENWVKCPEDLDQVDVVGSGDEPGQIAVVARRDGKAPRPLEFMDAVSGKPGEVILQDKNYDFNGWVFRDPVSNNIVGAVYQRAAPHVVWFTQAYRNLQKLVDGLFPNQVVRIHGMDDAGKMLLISNGADRQPTVYSWVDLTSHKSGLIKNTRPWIDPKRMRPMGIIKFPTAEGKQLDAYITLPAGATKANPPPVVVMPYPWSNGRWTWQYNSEVQFLASRGYAVLQPNHRGAEGYTWMYPESEDWDLKAMSDDIAAATRKAIEMGLVDGKRVAVLGGAFGGYLSAAAATFNPGLYKCCVSLSAYYDWARYLREENYSKYSSSIYSRYLYKLGNPATNAAKFDAMSPLPHAADFHGAALVVWGEYDSPEVISQSREFAAAVGRSNTSETLSYLDEAAGVHHLGHEIDLYQHVEAFLAKNL